MSKTPISILQEYLVKSNGSIPVYNCIGDRTVGTNDHEFTIRVTSGDLSADGKGSTKKEAKHNAAKEMILLISGSIPPPAIPSIDNNNMTAGSRVVNSSMEIDGPSSPAMGTNYIGLLHEYCAQKRLTAPTFIDVASSGPCHMKSFTIRCQVANIVEEAIARTKKQAKTDAAKKVWFKLSKQMFDPSLNQTIEDKIREVGVEIKDLKLEEILPDYKEIHEIAKKNYLKLTNLKPASLISDKLPLADCHHAFKSKYNLTLRQSIIVHLNEISPEKEDVLLLPGHKFVLEKVTKLLDVKLQKLQFVHRKSSDLLVSMRKIQYTIGFKLHTEPTIVSICSAETLALAELKAIVDMAMNLKFFLN